MTHHNSKIFSFLNLKNLFYFIAVFLLLNTFTLKADDDKEWSIRVANWNILNFSDRKAGLRSPYPNRDKLLKRYAALAKINDIIFFQEILNDGRSITQAVASKLTDYNCTVYSPSGRTGRPERYSICYNPGDPATGVLALNNVNDFMVGPNRIAADGSMQTAQNVWMRPPIVPTFTYTPKDGKSITFSVYNIHTKHKYSDKNNLPPGTPTQSNGIPTRISESVKYELKSLQDNLISSNDPLMVIGDLNADCTFFPNKYEGLNFKETDGWNKLIKRKTKTNLRAKKSKCALDRIILNAELNKYYLDHGIDGLDSYQKVDDEWISDHALVWVKLGGKVEIIKKPQVFAALVEPAVLGKRTRSMASSPSNPKRMRLQGFNMCAAAASLCSSGELADRTVDIYITKYDPSRNYKSNQTYDIADVRGRPTPVSITTEGKFEHDVVWNNPVKGLYNFVIHTGHSSELGGSATFNRLKGDFTNYNNEIDIIVTDGSEGHNQLVTLDDNGNVREDFNASTAKNVYSLAKGLPESKEVDIYVVSQKLLRKDGFTTWEEAKNRPVGEQFGLEKYAIPVNEIPGLIESSKPALVSKPRTQTVLTSPEGTLFFSAWKRLPEWVNTSVVQGELPDPDYKEEYLELDERDPCIYAFKSGDANFRRVCNVVDDDSQTDDDVNGLYSFLGYYGNSFNVVIDVDKQGEQAVINKNTVVDTHDIGDMEKFFRKFIILDHRANGNPAVGEYKEFLNAKLNLNEPLSDDNIYDEKTRAASKQYLCAETVSRYAFELIIKLGAEVGFQVMEKEAYIRAKETQGGVFRYDNVEFFNTEFSDRRCSRVQELAKFQEIIYGENAEKLSISMMAEYAGSQQFRQGARGYFDSRKHVMRPDTKLSVPNNSDAIAITFGFNLKPNFFG